MRCTNCRFTEDLPLPRLNKKAVYLDQFMFSLIYNVKNNGNLPLGHEAFAKEVYDLLKCCVRLQQIFLPHSDIHHDETTVFHSATDFRMLYEFFGGNVTLKDHGSIELVQILEFLKAFFDNKEPEISFSLDEVTDSSRDEWLPDMHVGVRADYSQYADGIRIFRGEVHEGMKNLAETWAEKKPSFEDVLENEFAAFGRVKKTSLEECRLKVSNPMSNPMYLLTMSNSQIFLEFSALKAVLEKRGIPEAEHIGNIEEFWDWEKNREIPQNKFSSYLFAAIARRVAMGERKIIDKGLMNDVNTISTYAPYMNAMFIDKTCAALLTEEPLISELEYKARIFSLSDTDAFITYLKEIEAGTPDNVRELAARIYGVE